jgi:hypothetical protein
LECSRRRAGGQLQVSGGCGEVAHQRQRHQCKYGVRQEEVHDHDKHMGAIFPNRLVINCETTSISPTWLLLSLICFSPRG